MIKVWHGVAKIFFKIIIFCWKPVVLRELFFTLIGWLAIHRKRCG